MRYLFTRVHLKPNFGSALFNFHFFPPRFIQLLCLSILSKGWKSLKRDKISTSNIRSETKDLGLLFSDILGILGTENIVMVKYSPSELITSKETLLRQIDTGVVRSTYSGCGVSSRVEEKKDHRKDKNLLVLGNGVQEEIEFGDVSPTVHQITEIIRGESDMVSMEDKLENAKFEYNSEVVEKVLKRCFKVPHLGLMFFNWVKSRNEFQRTEGICNTVIQLASEAKEFGLVEELVDEVGKSSSATNIKTWTIIVSHYCKAKLIGKALYMFEKMKKAGVEPDGVACKTILYALCSARKADLALEFYKEMVQNVVDVGIGLYKQLLKCLALCGDVVSVHSVGDDMINVLKISEPIVYGLMLKSFCIAGRIREALELIRDMKMKNISLDTEIFVTLVQGLCCVDRIAEALEIIEIMKIKYAYSQKINEILLSTYLKKNEVPKALDIFKEMKKSGDISVSAYKKLIQHLFCKNDFQNGMELYHEMIELGMQLDSLTIVTVAAACVRQNCFYDAWKIFKTMEEKGIKATSKEYAIFVNELSKVSRTDEIDMIFNDMHARELNTQVDIFEQVLTYLKSGGGKKNIDTMKLIQRAVSAYLGGNDEHNINALNLQVPVEKSEPNLVEQRKLLDCTPKLGSRSACNHYVSEVCQILSSSDDWCVIQGKLEKYSFHFTPDDVVQILHNCRLSGRNVLYFFTWLGKKTGYTHNVQSYNMAIKIAGQGKDFKEMRRLFHEMKRRGCSVTPDTWTIMIMQYGRTGLTNIALSNFREMKRSGCKPTSAAYNSIITSLCGKKGRKLDEAIHIYQEMIRVGLIPDKEVVEAYLRLLCESNKLSDARNCLESLLKCGFTIPLAYSMYFRALCRVGKLENALALMNEVGAERSIMEQYTYGSLIHCLLRGGRLEEALEKIKTMKQIGVHPTTHVYTSLIVYFFNAKEISTALETLEEMKKVGCHPTVVTYSAVICGYVRSGLVTEAWNVFKYLKQNGPQPDFKTYSMFINCLSKTGKSEEAFRLIPEMMVSGIVPSTINFQKIIYGLNREGNPKLAWTVLKKKLDLKRQRKLGS